MKLANCRSCHASVIWTETEKGKKMPVDAERVPNGNIELREGNPPIAVYAKADGASKRYISHFVTCPQAKQHRKP